MNIIQDSKFCYRFLHHHIHLTHHVSTFAYLRRQTILHFTRQARTKNHIHLTDTLLPLLIHFHAQVCKTVLASGWVAEGYALIYLALS